MVRDEEMRGEMEYESYEGEMEYESYESFEAYFDYLEKKMRRIVDELKRLLDIEGAPGKGGDRMVEVRKSPGEGSEDGYVELKCLEEHEEICVSEEEEVDINEIRCD